MVDLSVVILTKNEENNIEKCIKSFKGIAKKFIIVDSFSNDNTIEICNKLKNKYEMEIYEHEFINYATQMNWGINSTNINTEWTMRMDADEELTEELANEINNKLHTISSDINGIVLNRRMYFMGKWIKHGGRYPQYVLRIFRTGKALCEMKNMDEHMILLSGNAIQFKYDFIDNNTKDLEWWIKKHNWYSSREVIDFQSMNTLNNESLLENNMSSKQAKKVRWIKNNFYYKLPLFYRSKFYFLYRYYIQMGFLDGKEGKIYHFMQAYWYRFLIDSKIYECEKFGIGMKEKGDLK